MYTIEIKNIDGVFVAKLYLKFPWEKIKEKIDEKKHADFSILCSEIKNWAKKQRKNELKYG